MAAAAAAAGTAALITAEEKKNRGENIKTVEEIIGLKDKCAYRFFLSQARYLSALNEVWRTLPVTSNTPAVALMRR